MVLSPLLAAAQHLPSMRCAARMRHWVKAIDMDEVAAVRQMGLSLLTALRCIALRDDEEIRCGQPVACSDCYRAPLLLSRSGMHTRWKGREVV
jgi:hypothetical protein